MTKLKFSSISLSVLLGVSFCLLILPFGQAEEVHISTATGETIEYDDVTGHGVIVGSATVITSTATLTADKITIDNTHQEAHLEGRVTLIQDSSTVTGSEVFYNWGLSTGVIYNAKGQTPPYYFRADRMFQIATDQYKLEAGEFTTCDGDPPHYRIRSSRGKMVTRKRVTMKQARFVIDELPVFWSPFYTRSLRPKKYQLRVEPGTSGRDGLILKTVYGYPFTPNSLTKLKWDYLQYTGNGFGMEHQYNLPSLRGRMDGYYIRDQNDDLLGGELRRYSFNWDHYQKFTDRLTGNAKFNFKSDQSIGNSFFGSGSQGLVENSVVGVLSEAGMTYQFPMASLNALYRRQDRFNSAYDAKSFVGQEILPSLTFQTIPLIFKYFPSYTSFSLSYVNQTQDRYNPDQPLIRQQVATAGAQTKKDFKIFKTWNLTPRIGILETFQSRDLFSTSTLRNWFQARANTGVDLRHRFFRTTDLTLSQGYSFRMEPNKTAIDETSDDHGVESNQISAAITQRVGRDNRVSLTGGWDFRQGPRSMPNRYDHRSARVISPSLDVEYHPHPLITMYYRETYSLYDTGAQKPRRTPLYTSGDVQFGKLGRTFFFSQGFNYSKPPSGSDSILYLNNKIRLFATAKWFVDGALTYSLIGKGGLDYNRAKSVEKTLTAVRDLHCWVFRMVFSSRPGRNEASFFIDLKTNLAKQKNVFEQDRYGAVFAERVDVNEIFPLESTTVPQD